MSFKIQTLRRRPALFKAPGVTQRENSSRDDSSLALGPSRYYVVLGHFVQDILNFFIVGLQFRASF